MENNKQETRRTCRKARKVSVLGTLSLLLIATSALQAAVQEYFHQLPKRCGLVDVVNSSAEIKITQLVGTQHGEPVVTMHDWVTFLADHFHPMPHLKN